MQYSINYMLFNQIHAKTCLSKFYSYNLCIFNFPLAVEADAGRP
jgi:hypothetical protein